MCIACRFCNFTLKAICQTLWYSMLIFLLVNYENARKHNHKLLKKFILQIEKMSKNCMIWTDFGPTLGLTR